MFVTRVLDLAVETLVPAPAPARGHDVHVLYTASKGRLLSAAGKPSEERPDSSAHSYEYDCLSVCIRRPLVVDQLALGFRTLVGPALRDTN